MIQIAAARVGEVLRLEHARFAGVQSGRDVDDLIQRSVVGVARIQNLEFGGGICLAHELGNGAVEQPDQALDERQLLPNSIRALVLAGDRRRRAAALCLERAGGIGVRRTGVPGEKALRPRFDSSLGRMAGL